MSLPFFTKNPSSFDEGFFCMEFSHPGIGLMGDQGSGSKVGDGSRQKRDQVQKLMIRQKY